MAARHRPRDGATGSLPFPYGRTHRYRRWATRTRVATRTPAPTHTTVPQCGDVETGRCTQWTPVPTRIPNPTETTIPAEGPCGTPLSDGGYPQYCLEGVSDGD
jgi:hypothetical protein